MRKRKSCGKGSLERRAHVIVPIQGKLRSRIHATTPTPCSPNRSRRQRRWRSPPPTGDLSRPALSSSRWPPGSQRKWRAVYPTSTHARKLAPRYQSAGSYPKRPRMRTITYILFFMSRTSIFMASSWRSAQFQGRTICDSEAGADRFLPSRDATSAPAF